MSHAYFTRRINDNYDLKFVVVCTYSKIGYCYPEVYVEGINQHSGLITRVRVDLMLFKSFQLDSDEFDEVYEQAEFFSDETFKELGIFSCSLFEALNVFEQVIAEAEDECNE